jgi:hypothetical protein
VSEGRERCVPARGVRPCLGLIGSRGLSQGLLVLGVPGEAGRGSIVPGRASLGGVDSPCRLDPEPRQSDVVEGG